MNMIMSDAEESHKVNNEKVTRQMQSIFLRGDQIIHISPITSKLTI